MLSPLYGQTIATFKHNISQHNWPNMYKLWPNDCNISTQLIATALGATCWLHLATLCDVMKIKLMCMPWYNIVAQTLPNGIFTNLCCIKNLTIFKPEPTPWHNTWQQGDQTQTTCYIPQGYDMCWNAAIVSLGLWIIEISTIGDIISWHIVFP